MTDSLLPRSTRIVSSQLCRKLPSMPDTSIAFTIMRVSRKGTCRFGVSVLETDVGCEYALR